MKQGKQKNFSVQFSKRSFHDSWLTKQGQGYVVFEDNI